MYSITLIVAIDRDRVIGKNGDIPWRGKLRADMEHFQKYTTEKIVVMGRKTYESIPEKYRPLRNRENLVITRNRGIDFQGCGMVYDPTAIVRISEAREVCVIGGEEIYNLFLPHANKAIVSHIDTRVVDGDAFFPILGPEWTFSHQLLTHGVDDKNKFSFSVSEYIRRI